jgi:hypothetical protein
MISEKTREFVLRRDGFTCQMCGVSTGELHPDDGGKNVRLRLRYISDQSSNGIEDADNLQTVCSVCYEGAASLTVIRPSAIELLTQIRRAALVDQLEVLRWLRGKFPDK